MILLGETRVCKTRKKLANCFVGYKSVSATGKTYMAIGPTFTSVGGTEGTFTLGEAFKTGKGYNWEDDHLYVVNPDSCVADMEIGYIDEDLGWYDMISEESIGDVEFDIGTGFESSFAGGNSFDITSAGQLHQEGYSVDCTGKVYQFIVNATGRDIQWKELSVSEGYNWEDDHIYVIDPDTCVALKEIAYIDADLGWYDMIGEVEVNEELIPAGEGFQTSFAGGNSFTLDFPESIPSAK